MVEVQLAQSGFGVRCLHVNLKGMRAGGAVRAACAPQDTVLEGLYKLGLIPPVGVLDKGGPVCGAKPSPHTDGETEVGALTSALHRCFARLVGSEVLEVERDPLTGRFLDARRGFIVEVEVVVSETARKREGRRHLSGARDA